MHDITEKDAIAEGVIKLRTGRFVVNKLELYLGLDSPNYKYIFSELWNEIYMDDNQKQWDANPLVWVYEFKVIGK